MVFCSQPPQQCLTEEFSFASGSNDALAHCITHYKNELRNAASNFLFKVNPCYQPKVLNLVGTGTGDIYQLFYLE